MKDRTLATRLAAVPDLARDAMPALRDAMPSLPWRTAPRVWTAPNALAAFGLGLALGTALGLLLRVTPVSDGEPEQEPTPDS